MSDGVLVRPAGMSDVAAAHRVSEALSVALHGTSETTVEHLRAAWDYGRAWVALDGDDEVVGYATLEDGYVEVWPHPGHRGGAVAGALLDAVTRHGGRLETIVPAAADTRAPHLNVRVKPPGRAAFATRLFFPNHARNTADAAFRSELVLHVTDGPDPTLATFDIVLNL